MERAQPAGRPRSLEVNGRTYPLHEDFDSFGYDAADGKVALLRTTIAGLSMDDESSLFDILSDTFGDNAPEARAILHAGFHCLTCLRRYSSARLAVRDALRRGTLTNAKDLTECLDCGGQDAVWVYDPSLRAGQTTELAPHQASLFGKRVILVGAELDDDLAHQVTAQLLLLELEDPAADISLYINSKGGSVTAVLAVLDTMRSLKPHVSTWAAGLAAGTAQLLLTGGEPGKRYALPRARVLLMSPTRQRWFTAQEAVDHGLIDHVTPKLGG